MVVCGWEWYVGSVVVMETDAYIVNAYVLIINISSTSGVYYSSN